MATRRGNREGSFHWNATRERWEGRLLISGVGRIAVVGRKGESKAAVRERLHAKRDELAGMTRPASGTLGEWLSDWQRLYLRNLASRTRASYAETCDRWLTPLLGEVKMPKLTVEAVIMALDAIPKPPSRRYAYTVLRIALGRAVKVGRAPRNVCLLMDPPPVERRVVSPPTVEEAAHIVAAAGERDEALILVALTTGLRQGEIIGLRWRDLEVNGGLHVGRAASVVVHDPQHAVAAANGLSGTATLHVRGQLERGTRRYVGAKRGSERAVDLPPVTADALERHRQRVTLSRGRKLPADEAVFLDAHGRPMQGWEARRRWSVALEAAGVPARPFHAARHFAHTLMDEQGMSGPMIDVIFGHRDARMRATYTHATAEARRKAAGIMQEALG